MLVGLVAVIAAVPAVGAALRPDPSGASGRTRAGALGQHPRGEGTSAGPKETAIDPDDEAVEASPRLPPHIGPLPDVRPSTPVEAPAPPAAAATRAGERVLAELDRIATTMTATRYEHATRVRERSGEYYWDCSGMADWILRRTAPRARSAITRERPVARDFYRLIARAPTQRPRAGWTRVDDIRDVLPGDVFAWERPPGFPSRNTGHVGFVLDAPVPVPEWGDAYAVRVADATSLPHESDSRPDGGDGGFGHGTIVFLTDGDGHGYGYAWFGRNSRGYVETPIAFGRVHR